MGKDPRETEKVEAVGLGTDVGVEGVSSSRDGPGGLGERGLGS